MIENRSDAAWMPRLEGAMMRRVGAIVAILVMMSVTATGCQDTAAPPADEPDRARATEVADPAQPIPREDIAAIRGPDGNPPPRPTAELSSILREGDVEQLLAFLYWERDPDQREEEFPILIRAVSLRQPEIVRTLIRYGADVNAPGRNDMTALHWAVRGDNLDIAETLLANGANPNARGGPNRDTTPMQLAANRGHREMIELLGRYGGTP